MTTVSTNSDVTELSFDYIVIGTGIAGLSAALELAKSGKTAIISKNSIKSGATHYAQGGIAVAFDKEDTPDFHLKDTLEAGAGLCDPKVVKILVEEGLERVKELIRLGTQFDKSGTEYDLGKEGAHHKRRILHAKDATGREIERVLGQTLQKNSNVTVFQNTMITQLTKQAGRVIGCKGFKDEKTISFKAGSVLIATGGCGQIFSHSTNPPGTTGDGIAIAWEAGCEVQDMEFIQFHPTTLYTGDKKPISIFLISEAVRGEGAVLRNINGHRFMENYHPMMELAPRDIVSRSIVEECQKTNAEHVYLDLTNISGNLAEKFPTIYERCLQAKIDIQNTFIPVAPAAHFLMGGIKVTDRGETNLLNLYACGEVACMGIHGANRLASNSLLDGLVFGHRTAQAMVSHANSDSKASSTPETSSDKAGKFQRNSVGHSNEINRSKLVSLKHQIRTMMWKNGGIYRTKAGLEQSIKVLEAWQIELELEQPNIIYHEVKSLMRVAWLVLKFSLIREESRGGHFRKDFPKTDDRNWLKHIVARDGEFKTNVID